MSSAAAPTPVAPGALLAGKYRVVRVLGQGGMGVVVEARHDALDERVALKFLLAECAQHPDANARFLREARNAVKIKSEHVARVSDVGTLDDGAPYMVMEFLEGRDLAGVLEKDGVLPIADAVDYVIQACDAIAEAHGHGIVHRDLKPANLFLTRRADGSPLVKVLDFGISKSTAGPVENLTKTAATMGSALYMSPEQMAEAKSVDHRTDIYALGISLFELLAGRQPFYAYTLPELCAAVLTGVPQPLRELRPDAPAALGAVLERAYARDRARRIQSVGELAVALAAFAPARSLPLIERAARMSGIAWSEGSGQVLLQVPPTSPSAAALSTTPTEPVLTIAAARDIAPAEPPRSRTGALLLAVAAVVVVGGIGAAIAASRSTRAAATNTGTTSMATTASTATAATATSSVVEAEPTATASAVARPAGSATASVQAPMATPRPKPAVAPGPTAHAGAGMPGLDELPRSIYQRDKQ